MNGGKCCVDPGINMYTVAAVVLGLGNGIWESWSIGGGGGGGGEP